MQLSCLRWARLRWDDTEEKHLEMRGIDFCVWTGSLLVQGIFEIMNMNMKLGTTLKIKGKIADDTDG